MGTSGRKSQEQFNRSVSAQIGAGAAVFQQLHCFVDTQNRKQLTRVSASCSNPAAPLVGVTQYFRVVICSGGLVADDANVTLIDVSPFFANLTLSGVDRVYYDQIIQNRLDIEFNEPLLVSEGQRLNVIMSAAWSVGDTILSPTAAIGCLSIQGYEGDGQVQRFPYELR